jgi:hypothetical protein
MFLSVEYARATINTNTPIGLLPLAIDEGDLDIRFAIVALKLD